MNFELKSASLQQAISEKYDALVILVVWVPVRALGGLRRQ